MKKVNYFAFLCVALVCFALLASGKYNVGFLEAVAYTAAETFTSPETTTAEGQTDTLDAIDGVFSELGLDNALVITDLIRYLSKDGNTFSQWVEEKYGDSIELPDSVETMSTSEIIMYLLSIQFGNNETTTSSADMGYTSLTTENHTQGGSDVTTGVGASTTGVVPAETTTKYNNMASYMTGDVNFDEVITAEDARITLRASAQLTTLDAVERHVADVNGDGMITANDARSILRYSAGLVKGF